jgi:ribosome biogenesis GTPase
VDRTGIVIRLDRGFPLVRLEDGRDVRCEHATALVKGERVRAVIGDRVSIALPDDHDKGIISAIADRRTAFVRKDPADRTSGQVLAANFDLVIVVEPIVQLNLKRLERELVLAHETGADVAVVLTKSDLIDDGEGAAIASKVADVAGRSVPVITASSHDADSIASVRALVPPHTTAILIGKSGVGKSTLVNNLAGQTVQDTAEVREYDGKGRHTTVDRVMIDIPDGGTIVDMPGVRGLGIWDADQGLGAAFPDVEELAQHCRFRDCSHVDEPGCAVREAVETGELAAARVNSYRTFAAEIADVRNRRAEASHIRGEKASDRRKRKRKRP